MIEDEQKTKVELSEQSNALPSRVSQLGQARDALRESEEKWRFLLKSSPDAILNLERDGTILFVNTVPGHTVEDTVGKTVYDLIPPEEHEKTRKAIEKVFQTGEAVSFETSVIGPDGNLLWYSTRLGPVKERDKVVSVAQISTDITKRKKVEEVLRESENKYRTLLENLPQKIFLKDRNSVYVSCNENYALDLHIKAEEIVGKTDYEFYPEELAEKYRADDKRIMQSGETRDIEERYIKDGQEMVVRTVKTPVKDERGNVIGVLGIFRDITERKKTAKAMQEWELRYHTLFESMPVAIGLTNKEGQILDWNDAVLQMTGYSDAEIRQVNLKDTYKNPEERASLLKQLQTDGLVRDLKVQLTRKDGRSYWASLTIVPFAFDGEDVLLTVAQDINERKTAEEKLRESEVRYRLLFEGTGTDNNVISVDGVYLMLNEKAAEHLGGKPEQFIGKSVYDTFPKDAADEYMKRFRRVAECGQTQTYEDLVELPMGNRWFLTNMWPVKDLDGNVTGIQLISHDITEHKKGEEEVRKLSTAVEQSIDGIAIGDLEPKLIYVNSAFARMHGYTPEDMVGMPITNLHNKEQMDDYKKLLNQLRTQGSGEGEIGHIRKDGTAFPTYASITLLKNSEGEPMGTLAVLRDITGTKLREEEFNIYSEKMARAEELASLGILSATVAHELTQPLTVIRLLIENALTKLEVTSSPETVTRRLKDSLTEVSNITSIVDRFRNYARRSSEKIVKEVELEAVAEKIVKLLNESARRAKIALCLNDMDKLPPVYSNEKDMEQLFFALTDNAIQAADGKKSRELIISGAVKNEHIELWFSDDCGGIAPENINKIFEPFFTTKPKGQGTGLGLCIVQSIVSRASGKIRVESKFGEGSTFFVTLPIKKSTWS